MQVFQHRGEWPNTLPAADLTPNQLQQLQRDAYRTLLYLSGLRGKRGLVGGHDPERRATYAAAVEAAELAHRFHKSQSGGLVQLFCNWQLGRPLQAPSLRDPNDAADSFFMGMLHFWMAQAAPDDPVNRLACKVSSSALFAAWISRLPWLLRSNCCVRPPTSSPSTIGLTSGEAGATWAPRTRWRRSCVSAPASCFAPITHWGTLNAGRPLLNKHARTASAEQKRAA